jgi:hypothetical protein
MTREIHPKAEHGHERYLQLFPLLHSGVPTIINCFVNIIRAFNQCLKRDVSPRLDDVYDGIWRGLGRAAK